MHAKGHFGLTLLIGSLLALPFGLGPNYLIVTTIFAAAALSSLPDIDIKLGLPHRRVTHTLLFGIVVGLGFGFLFGYSSGLSMGVVGFLAGIGSVASHILGDLLTYMEFSPLAPFSYKRLSFKKFRADDPVMNKLFFDAGIIMFFLYVFISSGTLEYLPVFNGLI